MTRSAIVVPVVFASSSHRGQDVCREKDGPSRDVIIAVERCASLVCAPCSTPRAHCDSPAFESKKSRPPPTVIGRCVRSPATSPSTPRPPSQPPLTAQSTVAPSGSSLMVDSRIGRYADDLAPISTSAALVPWYWTTMPVTCTATAAAESATSVSPPWRRAPWRRARASGDEMHGDENPSSLDAKLQPAARSCYESSLLQCDGPNSRQGPPARATQGTIER